MSLPPLEFFLEVSLETLQELELASRNQAAMLSKTLRREIDAWIEYEATAMMARQVIEERKKAEAQQPKKVAFFDRGEKKSA